MQSIICSYARTPVAHAVGKSIWTEFKRPRFEPWLDLNLQKRVVRCPLTFLFWVFKDAHTQLKPLYPLSTFNAFMWQKKQHQALHACTTSMFAFWSMGAWERGYLLPLFACIDNTEFKKGYQGKIMWISEKQNTQLYRSSTSKHHWQC